MGYYVTGSGSFSIRTDDLLRATVACRDLVNHPDRMGGSASHKRADGSIEKTFHYGWVDMDELRRVDTVARALELFHFQVDTHADNEQFVFEVFYDMKTSDEDDVLRALAPYVVEGEVRFRGESGEVYRYRFDQGGLLYEQAQIVWPDGTTEGVL